MDWGVSCRVERHTPPASIVGVEAIIGRGVGMVVRDGGKTVGRCAGKSVRDGGMTSVEGVAVHEGVTQIVREVKPEK